MIMSHDRKNRLTVYERRESGVDELGCVTYDNVDVGHIWGQIIPGAGKEINYDGNMSGYEVTHRIRVRNDLYKYGKGMHLVCGGYKYEVVSIQPIYNQQELVELNCKMIVEE